MQPGTRFLVTLSAAFQIQLFKVLSPIHVYLTLYLHVTLFECVTLLSTFVCATLFVCVTLFSAFQMCCRHLCRSIYFILQYFISLPFHVRRSSKKEYFSFFPKFPPIFPPKKKGKKKEHFTIFGFQVRI